ncbi:hypothetical protein [Fodinicola acaciae]|uniref:hypothetical protein n=1 Tax=Fodinicola acaciae TaxID=2681555 RepID=UPI0013D8B1F4|nr:hypothetical protein [Fodinicola acaciae]
MAKKSRRPPERRTIYAKVLRLKTINPGPVWSFLFFEVAIAVGIVLALLGFVSWWGVLVLPLAIAAMVKLNDVVATATERSIKTPPEPEPEPEPQPAQPPPSGMSAAREHRKAQRERVREEKRLAREEQKAQGRGPVSDDTAVIPADPSLYARPRSEHTQVIPVVTDPPSQRKDDGETEATQQLPVVPDELDDFMSDIRGNRPPPWDPAAEQGAPEEALSGNRRRGRKQR